MAIEIQCNSSHFEEGKCGSNDDDGDDAGRDGDGAAVSKEVTAAASGGSGEAAEEAEESEEKVNTFFGESET